MNTTQEMMIQTLDRIEDSFIILMITTVIVLSFYYSYLEEFFAGPDKPQIESLATQYSSAPTTTKEQQQQQQQTMSTVYTNEEKASLVKHINENLQEIHRRKTIEIASLLHEGWRQSFDPTGLKPRMKKSVYSPIEVNINVPFEQLTPDWQEENLLAAYAAYGAIQYYGKDSEKLIVNFIHDEWMKRNPKQDWNAHQHVRYEELSEDDKQKDIDQYIIALRVFESIE
jgi:transposase-like protein